MSDDLSRFRWHVGAAVRRPDPDVPLPTLYRDLGLHATAAFLRGRLRCLSGRSPVVYLRTPAFREPYHDHEAIGRLLVLRAEVWCTGVPEVWVASVKTDPGATLFVPGTGTADLAALRDDALRSARSDPAGALREALGGPLYDEARADALGRVETSIAELAATEVRAEPLRRRLQRGTSSERAAARAWMDDHGVTEADLCAAWHHLPRARRDHLRSVLG